MHQPNLFCFSVCLLYMEYFFTWLYSVLCICQILLLFILDPFPWQIGITLFGGALEILNPTFVQNDWTPWCLKLNNFFFNGAAAADLKMQNSPCMVKIFFVKKHWNSNKCPVGFVYLSLSRNGRTGGMILVCLYPLLPVQVGYKNVTASLQNIRIPSAGQWGVGFKKAHSSCL